MAETATTVTKDEFAGGQRRGALGVHDAHSFDNAGVTALPGLVLAGPAGYPWRTVHLASLKQLPSRGQLRLGQGMRSLGGETSWW